MEAFGLHKIKPVRLYPRHRRGKNAIMGLPRMWVEIHNIGTAYNGRDVCKMVTKVENTLART
jgi:hypothetical protein